MDNGRQVGGAGGSTFAETNVVALIDILLVLLVMFMIIPHQQKALDAVVRQPARKETARRPES